MGRMLGVTPLRHLILTDTYICVSVRWLAICYCNITPTPSLSLSLSLSYPITLTFTFSLILPTLCHSNSVICYVFGISTCIYSCTSKFSYVFVYVVQSDPLYIALQFVYRYHRKWRHCLGKGGGKGGGEEGLG